MSKEINMIKNIIIFINLLIWSNSLQAALLERLGGLAYYDDVANLTWLTDANYSATQYVNSDGMVGDADGRMTWNDANAWAANLNIGGVTGWRLPDTIQPDATCDNQFQGTISSGFNCTGSEMGNMYYNVLGGSLNNGGVITPTPSADYALFRNIQFFDYWSATEFINRRDIAWIFNFAAGIQQGTSRDSGRYAWAVQSGDVATVPIPPAILLFGSGFIALIGLSRRK